MRKRIRKVHLRTNKTDSGLACNSTVFTPLLTSDLDEVTCNCCKGTDIFKRKVQITESGRVASSEELGIKDDEFEVFKYEHFTKHQLCPYELGESGTHVNSLNCRKCDYNEYYNVNKTEVGCSYKAKNKLKESIMKFSNVTVFKDDKHMEITGLNRDQFNLLFNFLKKKSIDFSGTTDKTEIIPDIESYETIVDFIKQNYNNLDETFLQEPDLFTKYNLNATHKAFIKECGEVEPMNQDNKNCFGCCFHYLSMHSESIDYIDCSGVKCIENKVKFRLKKEEIMSEKTELLINDGTPGKQLSCYFSKLNVGDYFLYAGSLCRKVLAIDNESPIVEVISTGNLYNNSTSLFDNMSQNTVEMVEKVTIQYIRKEQ